MKIKSKKRLSTVIINIIMWACALFWLYPYAWMIAASLKPEKNIYSTSLFQGPFTFENYIFMYEKAALMQMPFIRALGNSIFIALLAMACVILSSSIVAYGLSKHEFRGKKFIVNFLIFQMIFPAFMFVIPLFILIKNLSLINTYPGIFLIYIMGAGWIFMLYLSYRGTPTDFIEAARIDGASEFWIIFKVMLPLNKAMTAFIGLMAFTGAWGDFMWPLIVMQNYNKAPLALMLGNFSMQFQQYIGATMAGAVLLILPVVVGFLIFRNAFMGGINISLK